MKRWLTKRLFRLPMGPLYKLRKALRNPARSQERYLRWLLRTAADTEWGRNYGYAELLKAPDVVRAFQDRVPLQNFDSLATDIERTRRREADVLWPGQCRFFGLSGGTYSAGKMIPAREEMIRRTIDCGISMSLNYLATTGNIDVFYPPGKIVPLTGRAQEDPQYPGIISGNFSGVMTTFQLEFERKKKKDPEYQPPWLPVPMELLFIVDWEEKLDRLADYLMDQDVRYMILIPTWGLVLFKKLIARYNEKHGTHVSTVREIWPKFQLIASAGVPLAPYRRALEERIGRPDMHFINHYGAMEAGFIAFQSDLDDPAMLLHLESGDFFEFVPVEELGSSNPLRLSLAEVEVGQEYVPHVSNANGLWAYGIGDVVRFTQTNPHKLEVVRRTAEMLASFRECLYGEQVRSALEHAIGRGEGQLRDYHVTYAPTSEGSCARHQWLLEFESQSPPATDWPRILDEYLRACNSTYENIRARNGLGEPEVLMLPKGSFARGLEAAGRKLDMQTKVPHMAVERHFADAVLSVTAPPGSR